VTGVHLPMSMFEPQKRILRYMAPLLAILTFCDRHYRVPWAFLAVSRRRTPSRNRSGRRMESVHKAEAAWRGNVAGTESGPANEMLKRCFLRSTG